MQADEGTSAPRELRSRIDHRSGKRVLVHDASFWQMHIAERRRLGQSVHTYCSAQGLAPSTFRRWAQRLEDRESSPGPEPGKAKVAFLRVPIGSSRRDAAADSVIEVSLGSGVRVKLTGAAALQVVGAVLGCVERAAQS
jgi:hypothetical protein